MRALTVIAALAMGAALGGCDEAALAPAELAPAATAEAAATTSPAPASETVAVSSFDTALNAFRTQNGQSRATPDARLMAAAQRHADDMAANGYFDHRSRDGRTYIQRIAAAGYSTCWPVENIAWGQHGAEAAIASWAASPPHRRNMLGSGTVQYGVGQAGTIWVLDLARVC